MERTEEEVRASGFGLEDLGPRARAKAGVAMGEAREAEGEVVLDACLIVLEDSRNRGAGGHAGGGTIKREVRGAEAQSHR